MYTCQHCNRTAPPRTPATRVVVKTRRRLYPEKMPIKVRRNGKVKIMKRNAGVGTEIVREIVVCPGCAATLPPPYG